MTDPAEIRRALAAFLGEESYLRFVAAYQQRRRFRFWQEKEWERFIAANPDFAASDSELLNAVFRICLVHGDELRLGTAKVFHGCRDFSPLYNSACATRFPHASDDISTEGRDIPENEVAVFYCPTCRQVKKEFTTRSRPPAY